MDLLQAILNTQNGGAVSELARHLNLDERQATSALEQLVPALAAGVKQNVATPQGLDGLMSALGSGRHAQYLDDVSRLGSPATIQDGNGILGHIFGSKDVSRQVATSASARTGIGADVLKKMLPMVAALAMGAMARQAGSSPRPPGPTSPAAASGGGLMDMLSPMLDRNRDGSVADEVTGMLGKLLR
jgi:hypothetical protein